MRSLKLSNNKLTSVPDGLFMMPKLELLLIARNQLRVIGTVQQQGNVIFHLNATVKMFTSLF